MKTYDDYMPGNNVETLRIQAQEVIEGQVWQSPDHPLVEISQVQTPDGLRADLLKHGQQTTDWIIVQPILQGNYDDVTEQFVVGGGIVNCRVPLALSSEDIDDLNSLKRQQWLESIRLALFAWQEERGITLAIPKNWQNLVHLQLIPHNTDYAQNQRWNQWNMDEVAFAFKAINFRGMNP